MTTRPAPVKILPSFFLLLSFCTSPSPFTEDVAKKTFYTAANIWYQNPRNILSTNYHVGNILPVGTRVTVDKVTRDEIRFRNEYGQDFRFIFIRKHSSKETDIWNYFVMYFSAENPLREAGPYEKFSDKEKENIKQGTIEVGMTKEAVLMSYGYPPSHRTPSLDGDTWVYWTTHSANAPVHFRYGKVSKSNR